MKHPLNLILNQRQDSPHPPQSISYARMPGGVTVQVRGVIWHQEVVKAVAVVDAGPPFEIPQGVTATIPLPVTNLSVSSASGNIMVRVKTNTGAVIFDQSYPFSVAG